MATDSMPAQGPYRKTFQKLLQQFVAKKLRCGRGDDVVTGVYMPVARQPDRVRRRRPDRARRVRAMSNGGRVRVLERHCHDMTHLCHCIALLRCSFVRGKHLRTMARAWIRCPSSFFPLTHMRTQDMMHTPKVRDLSRFSPREGSPCPRRLVYQI